MALAARLKQEAGDGDAALARHVAGWLSSTFGYTTELPGADPSLAHFLFDRRRGHCEYFATALAVLLRLEHVPARVATGFYGASWSDAGGYYVVRRGSAHAWVEAWIPGRGWVRFNPTPAADRGAQGGDDLWTRLSDTWDAVQSAWSNFVLDYGLGNQVQIFLSAAKAVRRFSRAFSGHDRGGLLTRGLLVLVFLGAAVLGVLAWRRRRPQAWRRLTRAPEQPPRLRRAAALGRLLRRALADAGPRPAATPEELLAELRARRGGEDLAHPPGRGAGGPVPARALRRRGAGTRRSPAPEGRGPVPGAGPAPPRVRRRGQPWYTAPPCPRPTPSPPPSPPTPSSRGARASASSGAPCASIPSSPPSWPSSPGRRSAGASGATGRILATADVLAASGIEAGPRALPLSFGRPFDLGGLQLEAVPSGHLRGAAQLRILTPAGLEVCYAPGLRRCPGRTVPGATVVPCEVLVLEAPFAEPTGALPSREVALRQVLAFVDAALADGVTPVLRAEAPGAPAELLALLADHDRPVRIHRRLRRRLAAAGLLPRGTGAFPGPVAPGETVILPPEVEAPAGARVCRVGPAALAAPGPDAAVAYADHEDDPGLLAHALDTGARRILTFGPGATRLAGLLADAGLDAAALAPAEQLELL